MNELIPIIPFKGQEQAEAVSAKVMYEFLYPEDNGAHFYRWATKNIVENEFSVRGEDWEVFTNFGGNPQGGRPSTDYVLRLDFAKRLAMMARSERGEKARTYFLECEKKAKSPFQVPQTLPEALRLAAEAFEKLEAAKPAIEFHAQVTASEDWLSMRKAAAVLNIKGLGQNNLFAFLRGQDVLMRNNIPQRRYIEQGYFRVQEFPSRYVNGQVFQQTMVSQKGLDFILRQWNRANTAAVAQA